MEHNNGNRRAHLLAKFERVAVTNQELVEGIESLGDNVKLLQWRMRKNEGAAGAKFHASLKVIVDGRRLRGDGYAGNRHDARLAAIEAIRRRLDSSIPF